MKVPTVTGRKIKDAHPTPTKDIGAHDDDSNVHNQDINLQHNEDDHYDDSMHHDRNNNDDHDDDSNDIIMQHNEDDHYDSCMDHDRDDEHEHDDDANVQNQDIIGQHRLDDSNVHN
ncbi:uncharacterized protein LOC134205918 [Armigeres subalbatus]|uniref:uncharacterized protein LOC134205918 n=1 Tax=Armigeres subalbatus TaxID=124917 RepID=UPI002ED1797A